MRTLCRLLICSRLGHKWNRPATYGHRFYTCRRCGEPGFWVPTS